MNSNEIRKTFLDFFENKGHKIVPSAPLVVKNDPTLMFTNAGMNQFKDLFLGNGESEYSRVTNSQKCLRVSGKHNDLEEVGIDSYHQTMFEMLGNWSFGDYFKKETIDWAWELLSDIYRIDKERIYATVFGGDAADGLDADIEVEELWSQHMPKDRILRFDKKDNFWEMGASGPCGPCSELHVDLRSDEEREKISGASLVNQDHPQVIEIWNLVFIQYDRKADGELVDLPSRHIDTGMGLERIAMTLQTKTSNYDTDLFSGLIKKIEEYTGVTYQGSYETSAKSDIAMRVVADHLRAISFTIADGEMPSNTGAGYVIRRILRRATRYFYSFLNRKTPLLHLLVADLATSFADVFPELKAQEEFISKVILEEEKSFLRTLESGLNRLDNIDISNNTLDGQTAFELYDTYGFPIDLTRLEASERGWTVDESGFTKAMDEQKNRARQDASREEGDWIMVNNDLKATFRGYDHDSWSDAKVIKYRTIRIKDKDIHQLVLSDTPFYPEGGGQVGDIGQLICGDDKIKVLDTVKENDLIIHSVSKIPSDISIPCSLKIDVDRRRLIENNHSATHLLHAALRDVLGKHVQQKGSMVRDDMLRFDFSHFQGMTDDETAKVESIINQKIRENISLQEDREIAIDEAKNAGAMMLFGEKYGDTVRMITFDSEFSRELCGGCHVGQTGRIGLLKIVSESGIAAGVRRIVAVSSDGAEKYINEKLSMLDKSTSLFKVQGSLYNAVIELQEENKKLKKEVEKLSALKAVNLKSELLDSSEEVNGIQLIRRKINDLDSKVAKTMSYNLEKEIEGGGVIFLGLVNDGKPQLMLTVSQELVDEKGIHAGNLVKKLAQHIQGGGGGQPFFATAGGKDIEGIDKALESIESLLAENSFGSI